MHIMCACTHNVQNNFMRTNENAYFQKMDKNQCSSYIYQKYSSFSHFLIFLIEGYLVHNIKSRNTYLAKETSIFILK